MEKRKNLNFFKLLFISTLTILASFSIVNTNIFAATTDSNVTTSYSLYDNLSSQQKQQIVTGQPNIKLSHDHEKVTLIYKTKQNSQPTPPTNGQNGGNNIQNDGNGNRVVVKNNGNTVVGPTTISNELADKPLLANRSAELPQTAQGNSNRLLLPLVFMIMLIALGLLIWQRKHMRSILLAYVILGSSLAASGFVNAAAALPNEQTQTLAKGSTYSPNTAQEGYDYVGYIYTSNDDPSTPIPDTKGQVTVYFQTNKGFALADPVVLTGEFGDKYNTDTLLKTFDGYDYSVVQGQPQGTFSQTNQSVTYVYTPKVKGSIIETISSEIPSTGVLITDNPDGWQSSRVQPIGYTVNYDHNNVIKPGATTLTDYVGSSYVSSNSSYPTDSSSSVALGVVYKDADGNTKYADKNNFYADGTLSLSLKSVTLPTEYSYTSQNVVYSISQAQHMEQSDKRLKTNIHYLKKANGFNIYSYTYKNDKTKTKYVGVIAQEILFQKPEAITRQVNGYYAVDYKLLGLKMITLEDYNNNKNSIYFK